MRISVVTVVLNGADTLEDNIKSVLQQTHDDVEHIVIDGASTDGTAQILERYSDRIATIVSEPDNGLYEAMNKGIALATGDVVGTLNADDFYETEDALSTVAQAFRDDRVDAVYADLVYVEQHDTSRIVRYWQSQVFRPGLFEQGWIPAHPTFFVKRDIYRWHGTFDTQFKIQSDFDLCLRFLEVKRIRTVYLPQVLVRMRMGGVSNRSIATILSGNLESWRALRKYGINVNPLAFFARKWSSRIPQFFRRPDTARAVSSR